MLPQTLIYGNFYGLLHQSITSLSNMDGVRTAFAMVPCGVCTDNKFQDDEADVGVCYSVAIDMYCIAMAEEYWSLTVSQWLDHHRKQLEHGDTVYGPMKSGERFATPAIQYVNETTKIITTPVDKVYFQKVPNTHYLNPIPAPEWETEAYQFYFYLPVVQSWAGCMSCQDM